MKNIHKHHPLKHLGSRAPFAVRPHHARSVRKRHVFGLAASALVLILVAINGLNYIYEQYSSEVGASLSSRQELFAHPEVDQLVTVRATYGYGLKLDRQVFDLVATANIGGELQNFDIYNVSSERAYVTLQLTPKAGGQFGGRLAGSSMKVSGSPEVITPERQAVEAKALFDSQLSQDRLNYSLQQVQESTRTIAGKEFSYRSFSLTPKQQLKGALSLQPVKLQIMIGYTNSNRPLVIRVVSPFTAADLSPYDQVINTIFADNSVAGSQTASVLAASTPSVPADMTDLLRKFGLEGAASAKSTQLDNARIVATNIPAITKIYHVRCGAIQYRGQVVVDDSCSGMTGTGFLVSSDGLVATNGHVVAGDAKTTITEGMSASLLARMLKADGYSARDITKLTSDYAASTQMQASVVQAVQSLPADTLRYDAQKDFYLVALSSDVPNLEQIVKTRKFQETTTIKLAELKAVDYNPEDLTSKTGFSHSDIAVLKITGSNYPVVKLGSIDGLVQGAGITVVGYPSDAESNGLVKSDSLQTTATEGIVSAIREVNGNGGKVIQSDVAIGHGNSGGPAFDESGEVFGIATYLLDGIGGSTGISYLRDVKDLKNVLAANSLHLVTSSTTQQLWEQGLSDFYAAHYRKAITKFTAVKKAYAPHVLADQYIKIANQKIAAGDEAQSPVLGYVFVATFVLGFAGLIYAIVLIVRHRAHHHMYLALQAGYLAGPFSGMFNRPTHAQAHIETPSHIRS